jgi:hypothetical protein
MGSYFSKPKKVMNISFETLERSVDSMDVNSYPSFDKSTDWCKTRHIYSEQICFHEKYISWSIIGILLLFLIAFLYLSLSNNKQNENIIFENTDLSEI